MCSDLQARTHTDTNRQTDTQTQTNTHTHTHLIMTTILNPKLLLVGLTSQQQASVSQGRICTILRAATLRQKLRIKLSMSPSHSILTLGRPVPALAVERQVPGRVATGVPMFKSQVWFDPQKIPAQAGFKPGTFRSRGGRLTTRPTRQSLNPKSGVQTNYWSRIASSHWCIRMQFWEPRRKRSMLR